MDSHDNPNEDCRRNLNSDRNNCTNGKKTIGSSNTDGSKKSIEKKSAKSCNQGIEHDGADGRSSDDISNLVRKLTQRVRNLRDLTIDNVEIDYIDPALQVVRALDNLVNNEQRSAVLTAGVASERAIAAGDGGEIKKARRHLYMEARKYPKGVRDETGRGRRPSRKFGSARPELLPQPGVDLEIEENVPESIANTVTSAKEVDHPQQDSDSVACAPADSANEMDVEDMDRVSGTISTMVKKELLEIGNELYQTGLQVGMRLTEGGDRLQEIGERIAFIATKLNAE